MNAKPDDLATRFLLGELSEEERTQVEERCLADNEFFEEVLSAEDALIDRYLLGQLTDERRERAESLFRASNWQSREVSFTEELIASVRGADPVGGQTAHAVDSSTSAARPREEVADEVNQSESEDYGRSLPVIPAGLKNYTSRLSWAGGLALLLVCLAFVSWIFYHYSQTRPQKADQTAAERSGQEAREKLPEEAAREDAGKADLSKQPETEKEKRETPEESVGPRQRRRPERVASILLTPATLVRGGGSKTIKLKTETSKVQLRLALDEGKRYDRYSVLITTFDGRRVWSVDSLDAAQVTKGRIALTLPSTLFGYDDYKVELKGLPDDGDPVHIADYVFKVRN